MNIQFLMKITGILKDKPYPIKFIQTQFIFIGSSRRRRKGKKSGECNDESTQDSRDGSQVEAHSNHSPPKKI